MWLGEIPTPSFHLGDLKNYVKHADPGSALRRDQGHDWATTDYLLALIADQLAVANWQRTGKTSGRPKPIPRPEQDNSEKYGADPIPLSEFNSWWDENENEE